MEEISSVLKYRGTFIILFNLNVYFLNGYKGVVVFIIVVLCCCVDLLWLGNVNKTENKSEQFTTSAFSAPHLPFLPCQSQAHVHFVLKQSENLKT